MGDCAEKTQINLSITCRGCLDEQEEMHDLFGKLEEGLTLANILENTTSIKIQEEDTQSRYMCEKCSTTIVNFYNFKQVFLENQKYVQSFLNKICLNDKPLQLEIFDNEIFVENIIKIEIEDPKDYDYSNSADENNKFGLKQKWKYTCPECNKLYLTRHRFKDHMLKIHKKIITNVKEYCKKIGKPNKAVDSLRCTQCDLKFETIDDRQAHVKTHRNYICNECGAAFTKQSILSDHKQKHAESCKYVCPFCGKGFRHRSVFFKHKDVHINPRKHVCNTCGRRFNHASTLRTHIELLHVRSRNHLCNICGLAFPLPSTLRKHNDRKHSNLRENCHKCSHCTMAYKDKSSLDRHIMTKHDLTVNKPSCEYCGKEYTTTTNLFKHLRKSHGIVTSSRNFNICEKNITDENNQENMANEMFKTNSDILIDNKESVVL